MKRYQMDVIWGPEECPGGQWVEYEEAQAAFNAKDEEIAALKREVMALQLTIDHLHDW